MADAPGRAREVPRLDSRGRALKRFAVLIAAAAAACATLARSGSSAGVFRDVTSSSGIRFRFRTDLQRLKMITTVNGGCALGDADGDGRPDLYVTNSVPHWGKPNVKSCGRLYRNVGKGRFEDVTRGSGVHACGLGMGAFWVDIDGDGDLDLYLTNLGANQLFVNRGNGTFEEAHGTGLEDPLFSVGAAFLDYDGDGDVDVVVANYLDSTPEWERAQPQFELRVPDDYLGQPSHLFRNDGNGHFTDVTEAAGLAMPPADTKTLGVAVLDADGDGRPDLYFVNDRVSNRLFRNRGDGTFEETTAETGAGVLGTEPRAGMGVAVGDADGDGATDLFVTNFGGEPNSYYRNVEGTVFDDAGATLGGAEVGRSSVRWGTHFADFDNDGWPDLYAVGGHLAPRFARILGHYKSGKAAYVDLGDPAFRQKSVLLHNAGRGRFEEWQDSGDLRTVRMAGRGSAVADVDGDGDLDLFIVDLAGPSRLFENEVGNR
ncbi:MAG TPA: VCBS repeat-containing protein, partial [Thermoanaerobaculia bacterium]|nr:VCBS repeat-containing protein [Thermoanaerobaculia bacterium]